MNKENYIKLFRKHGFNCFPINISKGKVADSRYNAVNTEVNQPIKANENYGIIPVLGRGTAILDLDNKEKYRFFADNLIKNNCMVIETGKGWHIPVIGLTGEINKIELFDYSVSKEKIIEIQGPKHYVIGVGSKIFHDKLQREVIYENKGSNKIFDAKGINFNDFVDQICEKCHVVGKKPNNTGGSYQYLRNQFKAGKIPKEHQSNDYFHQAALVCNTQGNSREEAFKRIQTVYDKWADSKYFSNRVWSNVESKINEVYDKNDTIQKGRKKRDDSKDVDRTGIAQKLLEEKEIYSHKELHKVWENKNGFLELINDTLKTELYELHPEISKADTDDILFKLEAGSPDLPETNKDEVVFSNCKINVNTRKVSKSKDIADMGFRNYKYLPKSKKNEPKLFLKMLKDIDKKDHPRLFAGLKNILSGRFDIRITFVQGKTRVGKTTLLNILCRILGNDYAYAVDLKKYLGDRATQAHIVDKRLVVFTDIGTDWGDLDTLKNQTGEPQIHIRRFGEDLKIGVENKIKFFVTANDLPLVPDKFRDAMFGDRLSLVHNVREKGYKHDGNAFSDKVVKEEAEKIISWIINLPPSKCKYEDSEIVEEEWNVQAGPEIEWLEANYKESNEKNPHHIKEIITAYNMAGVSKKVVGVDKMKSSLKLLGYGVNYENIINYIQDKPKVERF